MIVAEGRQILGARVRALRETAGLTQENLAQAAGLGRITLVRLEIRKTHVQAQHAEGPSRRIRTAVEDLLSPARTASKQRTHSRRHRKQVSWQGPTAIQI